MRYDSPVFQYIQQKGMIDNYISYSTYMYITARMKLFNSAALVVQRPGLGFVASETTWEMEYHRHIKPEAKPLLVLKPFAPFDLLYEVGDTYSLDDTPLPPWMEDSSIVTSAKQQFDIHYESLVPILRKHGVYYSEKEMGIRQGGFIEYSPNPLPIIVEKRKQGNIIERTTHYTHYAMIINEKSDSQSKAMAIFHEIGHLLCGHLPFDADVHKDKAFDIRICHRHSEITQEQEEFEAEKVCELILNSLGYSYDRHEYLDDFLVDGNEPEYDIGVIASAADEFLEWLK